ncbi:protein DpdJ [Rubellimicrobium roseum]|nr:protein DpdJ [Rubellimicrobium roseum]
MALLDQIETLEMRSLRWGFTGGGLTASEASALCPQADQAEDVLEELIDSKLLLELSGAQGRLYRSRFAEAVRLLVANRQLFKGRPWQEAPHLVADFRVDRRPRRFPRRDLEPSAILAARGGRIAPNALRRALWDALTGRPGLRLAAFQERATLRLVDSPDDGGTIVTAGTGSGKTIAFYLPAMLRIGEAIGSDSWVKAVAVYPRIELLKDQFAEAFSMARAIDAALTAHGRRPLRIGALFSSTPSRAAVEDVERHGWPRRGRDHVCPWLRCPECKDDMLWRAVDLQAGVERLHCARPGCGTIASESHIALTRKRIQREPPDILFTTTEILNQRLSDHWMRGVFGVGSARKPFLALLDEVHTYEGTSGAQAALTFRRWRYLLGRPLHWAGLSATLEEANRFFSDLTGAMPERVAEVTPAAEEFEERGAEYQIVLRGDPAARTSLLSTTIQTAMLLPRVLDPPGAPASGAFGRRAFLFTDDLDVTNRLYNDLQDAEAYTIFGRPDEKRSPLAKLRAAGADDRARDAEGQRWRLCEDLGHPLSQRLLIGRTTSQDGGVAQGTNVVVATAALEVGFNDPEVGAVIQHKAPRGMASFLQRKGRAGRDRAMRPIMLTVLSDYGRDRAVFQSYERLFDPELAPQHLPIRNPYVLKMQATFALFDWLAAEAAGRERAWAWDVLSRPLDTPSDNVAAVRDRMKACLRALVRGDEATLASLQSHLRGALGVSEDVVQSLLWEAPRSLLMEAVPTLVRRLFRGWRLAFPRPGTGLDLHVPWHPLPDFVPHNLFSDLSLPEVRIVIPPATVRHEERTEALPIVQALNQLVPGRVTRRFAFERGALSHWVPVDPTRPEQDLRITEYAEVHEFVGEFTGRYNDDSEEGARLVFRPWTVRLCQAKRTDALPSSNARLVWRTDIAPQGEAITVPVSPRSAWCAHVPRVEFFLHRFRASAQVRRFAGEAKANVRRLDGDAAVTVRFLSDDGRPAALGFALDVDGIRLDLSLPVQGSDWDNRLPPDLLRACKLSYLRERLRTDPALSPEINVFQRDWLFEILCSVLFADVAATQRTIEETATDLLSDGRIDDALGDVIDTIFSARPAASYEDEVGEDEATGEEASPSGLGRLPRLLKLLVASPQVGDRLRALAGEIAAPDQQAFGAFIRRLVVESMAEAMRQACIAAAPRHATSDDLLADVHDDSGTGTATIWITETTLGGAGVLEAFAERFAAEPSAFFDAVEAALAPTDLELVDPGLRRVLSLLRDDPSLAEQVQQLRMVESHAHRARHWQCVAATLGRRGGVDLSHAFVASLNTRLLRPGTDATLDGLMLDLVEGWSELERRVGLCVGVREFAFVASRHGGWRRRIRDHLARSVPGGAADVSSYAAATALLWPTDVEVRRSSLQGFHPFRDVRPTDPAVPRYLLLGRSVATVELSAPDWRLCLNAALGAQGRCRLAAALDQAPALRAALVQLAASPVDVGALQFFPVVERIDHEAERIVADLSLREHA